MLVNYALYTCKSDIISEQLIAFLNNFYLNIYLSIY